MKYVLTYQVIFQLVAFSWYTVSFHCGLKFIVACTEKHALMLISGPSFQTHYTSSEMHVWFSAYQPIFKYFLTRSAYFHYPHTDQPIHYSMTKQWAAAVPLSHPIVTKQFLWLMTTQITMLGFYNVVASLRTEW